MNLLLYTKARMKLARRPGNPTVAEPNCPWGVTDVGATDADDMDIALPDDLFAELGYFGALDADEADAGATDDDAQPDGEFDSLFAAFAGPAFGALRQA